MVVRDVAVVVGWAELRNIVGYLATEAPSKIVAELPSDLPLLGLGPLKMEPHARILNTTVEHVLHSGLHILIPSEAVQQALTVFHHHAVHRIAAVAKHVCADGLQGHQHLVNEALRMACPHHGTVEIPDVAVEMIIVDPQILVDGRDLPPLVLLRPAQHLRDVHCLPVLDPLRVPQQQVLDAVVHQCNLVQSVHQPCDPVGTAQPLEQLVLALLDVLAGDLHADREPCCYVSTNGLQQDQNLSDVLLLHPLLLQSGSNDIQQTIKMVVRNVVPVMHGPDIIDVVGRRPPEL
mmetsp:Transcript_12632/g.30170  ORF Transcript_12632/g.30170 Transcript_12632/m.30170 type:complete len:291 (+) Transcript_12632:580-1452(+)